MASIPNPTLNLKNIILWTFGFHFGDSGIKMGQKATNSKFVDARKKDNPVVNHGTYGLPSVHN